MATARCGSTGLDGTTEIPYKGAVHTVIETHAFLRDAKAAGIDDDERADIVSEIARNPKIGEIMEGTGGVRKFRFAGRGHGKNGGYRIVTYFGGEDVPVFVLGALSKGEKSNLSKATRNELKSEVAVIADNYRAAMRAKLHILGKRRT